MLLYGRLTAALSINAVLEPRIAAVSSRGDFSAGGSPRARALITALSHGCFSLNLDGCYYPEPQFF
jgi:hypothetical protein